MDSVGTDIWEEKYNYNSGSKANRVRGFWIWSRTTPQRVSWKALVELIELERKPDTDLLIRTKSIIERLAGAASVDDLDVLVLLEAVNTMGALL